MELIDRVALKEHAYKEHTPGYDYLVVEWDDIEDAPTIDAVAVVAAHWNGWTTSAYIGTDEYNDPKFADRKFFRCSKCRNGSVVKSNYCPKCGAKMTD